MGQCWDTEKAYWSALHNEVSKQISTECEKTYGSVLIVLANVNRYCL